jgi:hypothetical protein
MRLKDDIKLFQENKNFEPKNRRRVTTNTPALRALASSYRKKRGKTIWVFGTA